MTRRPRLTLPIAPEETKQPPRGFAKEPRSATQSPEPKLEPQAPPAAAEPRPARAAKTTPPPPARNEASIATIAKVLLAVGIAALSIFLLKRRFF